MPEINVYVSIGIVAPTKWLCQIKLLLIFPSLRQEAIRKSSIFDLTTAWMYFFSFTILDFLVQYRKISWKAF